MLRRSAVQQPQPTAARLCEVNIQRQSARGNGPTACNAQCKVRPDVASLDSASVFAISAMRAAA